MSQSLLKAEHIKISFGNVHMAELPGPVIDIPENKSMELLQMLQIKMSTNGTGLCCRKAQ